MGGFMQEDREGVKVREVRLERKFARYLCR